MENIKQSTRDNPSRFFDLPENIWSVVLNFNEFLWWDMVYSSLLAGVALERPPHLHISRRWAEWYQPYAAIHLLTKFSRESSHQTRNATAPLIVMHTISDIPVYVPNTTYTLRRHTINFCIINITRKCEKAGVRGTQNAPRRCSSQRILYEDEPIYSQ